MFLTPSGRFETNTKICLSFSAYHPELWQPAWGIRLILEALIYLNDVVQGGQTSFPQLGLNMQPKQGRALVFFPSTVDGHLDPRALHAALPAIDTKYVSQIWIRQGN